MSLLSNLLDNNYIVYKLINHNKKEIYYGITNDFETRLEKHKNNNVGATSRWVFGVENIDTKIVEENMLKVNASQKAHALSDGNVGDMIRFQGYEVINTGGW